VGISRKIQGKLPVKPEQTDSIWSLKFTLTFNKVEPLILRRLPPGGSQGCPQIIWQFAKSRESRGMRIFSQLAQ
jgi:hypothetical protein